MDGHDEADHETGDEQRPGAGLSEGPAEGSIDPLAHPTARLRRHAEQPDQREHRDCPRDQIDRPRTGSFGPEQPGAQGDGRRHDHEPRRPESREHGVADASEDRTCVTQDREQSKERRQHQKHAEDLADLASGEARPRGALASLGTR